MEKHKIYVTDHVFKNLEPERAVLADAELVELSIKRSGELKDVAADAEVLLNTYLPNISAEVMDALPDLKGIVRYGIGVDTIGLAAAKARGIQVANVPDYCIAEVSDHAVALALALVRKTALSSQRIKSGDYSLSYVHPVRGLSSCTVTVIGYGRIGRQIARKMEAFGCQLKIDTQWARGKSFDTFCPLGSAVVQDINGDDAAIRTELNGTVMQQSQTSNLIFGISRLVSFCSRNMTLLPGTVILTGIPEGVGFSRVPPVYLAEGDRVDITIEDIGTLSNRVRKEGKWANVTKNGKEKRFILDKYMHALHIG